MNKLAPPPTDSLVVRIGDMKFTTDPAEKVATFALGSCIGIAAHDPAVPVGGILHFMLAEPSSEQQKQKRPLAYGSVAIPAFIAELEARGARRSGLIVRVAGGANMLKAANLFRIGERNLEITRRLLAQIGVAIMAEEVGGISGRSLFLDIKDGTCIVTKPGKPEVRL